MYQINPDDDKETIQDKVEINAHKEAQDFIKNVTNKKNAMLPEPPKPGEIMHCRLCGKPMLPENFSKDERTRQREFKWQIHEFCDKQMQGFVDRQVPGLLNERRVLPRKA